MPQTCPLDTPMREEGFEYGVASKSWNGTEMPALPEGAVASFVQDAIPYLDMCLNPQFRHTHSAVRCVYRLPVGSEYVLMCFMAVGRSLWLVRILSSCDMES